MAFFGTLALFCYSLSLLLLLLFVRSLFVGRNHLMMDRETNVFIGDCRRIVSFCVVCECLCLCVLACTRVFYSQSFFWESKVYCCWNCCSIVVPLTTTQTKTWTNSLAASESIPWILVFLFRFHFSTKNPYSKSKPKKTEKAEEKNGKKLDGKELRRK